MIDTVTVTTIEVKSLDVIVCSLQLTTLPVPCGHILLGKIWAVALGPRPVRTYDRSTRGIVSGVEVAPSADELVWSLLKLNCLFASGESLSIHDERLCCAVTVATPLRRINNHPLGSTA